MNDSSKEQPQGFIPAIVSAFLTGKGAPLLTVFALLLGAAAILITPREEEPQIVVPLADVIVQVPGASAQEVENLAAAPLERLLWQIDGVEYVYSTSYRDKAVATVRFYVGEDREDSLIKLHNTINMNTDMVPDVVAGWVVKPVEVDDVPIVTATLYSDTYDGHELRRIGEEVFHRLAQVEDVSRVRIIGGRPREVRVELWPERMAGLSVTAQDVTRALAGADVSVTAGSMDALNTEIAVSSDSFLTDPREVGELVVGVYKDRPVYLQDVATVHDGPAEADQYTRIGFSDRFLADHGREAEAGASLPAVTLAVAKKKGTNAVNVARAVLAKLDELERTVIPDGVQVRTTRDYGQTAQTKVGDLLNSLFFAIVTVVALLALTLGWREALIVAAAVPVSFALSLFSSMLLGFTINRVTLFALILSLGLVVDDPITNVDNIQRHILAGKRKPRDATLFAVREVLPPVLMSTLAIIISFTPMFFITGMMGPYMAPMAANVPLTVTFSTLCALTIVPWLSYQLLKNLKQKKAASVNAAEKLEPGPQRLGWAERLYRPVMGPFLRSRAMRWALVMLILAGLAGAASLAAFRQVPLKMLPFDNKNEFQLVIDMPEGTSLEATDRAVRRFESFLRSVPEVTDFTTYSGTNSAMDFNAMVRHYYLRSFSWQADIRVNLAAKDKRKMQSHGLVLRLRPELEQLARELGATLQIVESPPGPPVVSTVTAEVYGDPDRSYGQLIAAAEHVRSVMAEEPGVSDLDQSYIVDHPRLEFIPDKEKAALHGVHTGIMADTLRLTMSGAVPAHVHLPHERQPLPVRCILPLELRSSTVALGRMPLRSSEGDLTPLAELGAFTEDTADQPIFHKNLQRVVYVFAEMAGRAPGEAILDMQAALRDDPLPPGTAVEWAGEGEWKITLRVFRDLGLAFGAALLGIYILLILQTNSYTMPLLIMTAIPLTLLGIMPGFWLLNVFFAPPVGSLANPVFFTATSMIGMIALGGIVIRNSLVLIEFIQAMQAQGESLKEAVLQSGAVRLRPIVLTALTTALGAWPITLDPIFSGLAWALIFGLAASTVFTLVVVPTGYYAMYRKTE